MSGLGVRGGYAVGARCMCRVSGSRVSLGAGLRFRVSAKQGLGAREVLHGLDRTVQRGSARNMTETWGLRVEGFRDQGFKPLELRS